MRVGAHAAVALRGGSGELRPQASVLVEKLFWPIALHPRFENANVLGVAMHRAHRNLMGAPIVLGPLAIDLLGARPALRRAEHDHGPAGALHRAVLARVGLDALDVADDGIQRRGHLAVHLGRVAPLDEIGGVAVAAEKLVQFLMADASEHAGIGDLVAVEMQDRQDHTVRRRVQKLVRMPARRERPGFRLPVADDAGDDQIGIVEGGSVCVRNRVAKLAPLMHRARGLRRHMARNAARKRELLEEALHALFVRRDVRIDLAVGSLEIGIRHQARPAMARAGDVEHVQVVLPN